MKDPAPESPAQKPDTERPLEPGLYMVGTPIGNLEDLGFRALRALRAARVVAAEDTREAAKLLAHYGIQTKVVSIHENSTKSRIEEVVNVIRGKGTESASSLREGSAICAYISDAGTPGLCDPGAELVKACVEAGVAVHPVPGPSALMALLSVSGFRDSGFRFHGFFPRERKDRDAFAKGAAAEGGAHFFFESPHRIHACLEFLAGAFPQAPLVVGRELTKRFETITRGTCAEVAAELLAKEPRGEYALGLSLPAGAQGQGALREAEVVELVKELALLGAGQKVLVRVAMSHGMRKNEAYRLALELLAKTVGN